MKALRNFLIAACLSSSPVAHADELTEEQKGWLTVEVWARTAAAKCENLEIDEATSLVYATLNNIDLKKNPAQVAFVHEITPRFIERFTGPDKSKWCEDTLNSMTVDLSRNRIGIIKKRQ